MKKVIDSSKNKFVKAVYSLVVSFVAALLHSLCCLLPLVSVTASTSLLPILMPYKPLLLVIQLLVLLFLFYRIFQNKRQKTKNKRWKLYLDYSMLLVAILGLLVGLLEPFKTERQVLAERQFLLFKSNRSLVIQLPDSTAAKLAESELRAIKGIRTVRVVDQEIHINFDYEQVKQEEIIQELKAREFYFEY